MNVVVTGGRGFLGRAWRRRLRPSASAMSVDVKVPTEGRVICVDRSQSPDDTDDPFGHHSDLSEPESLLPSHLRAEEFTLVHLAWAADRPRLFTDHATHVARLAALLDHWGDRGLRRVVVAGSAEEYGNREGRLREDHESLPTSSYGWGKRAACELLRTWSKRTGIPVAWLRPFIVYGPGQRGNMLLPYALEQIAREAPARFSDGQQVRDFVYVDDAADAFAIATRAPLEGFHAINVGTGFGARVADVLHAGRTTPNCRSPIRGSPRSSSAGAPRRIGRMVSGEPSPKRSRPIAARSELNSRPFSCATDDVA
jgi:nucleoside-diphosphate-sugar epimerase